MQQDQYSALKTSQRRMGGTNAKFPVAMGKWLAHLQSFTYGCIGHQPHSSITNNRWNFLRHSLQWSSSSLGRSLISQETDMVEVKVIEALPSRPSQQAVADRVLGPVERSVLQHYRKLHGGLSTFNAATVWWATWRCFSVKVQSSSTRRQVARFSAKVLCWWLFLD